MPPFGHISPVGDCPVDLFYDFYEPSGRYYCRGRISPYYLYSEAVATIMNPSVRSINIITVDQLEGAIAGYLSLGQSLLLVWPHLTGMAALTLIAFTGSYAGFMCQEIRSS